MKYLGALLIVIFTAGCATTNQMAIATFETNPDVKLPAISVFMRRPAGAFKEECIQFDNKSVLNHCSLNTVDLGKFRDEMYSSGMFQDVLFANRDVGYRILLTSGLYNHEGGDDLGSAMVAGATLMLAPMIVSANVKVNASLYWYEYELKQFSYDLPMQIRASILSMNQDTDQDIAKSIASHILHDIQEDDIFSPAFLSKTIQSSDYENQLITPEVVGEYEKYGTNVFNNPFFGIQVRYQNNLFNTDFADVFIYPVRSADLEDKKAILKKEMSGVRKEIELIQKENNITSKNNSEVEFLQLEYGDQKVGAVFFEHEYVDTLSNDFISRTYLALAKDKFLKVRHTFLKGELQKNKSLNFATELVNMITVPEESLFMAKIRKQWRDGNLL